MIPVVITIFLVSGTTVFAAIALESAAVFMVAVAFVGACGGATCSTTLKFLLVDTTLRERAGVISALYLSAYVGSGLPNFAVGVLASNASMSVISAGFVVWMAATWLTVMGLYVVMKRNPTPPKRCATGIDGQGARSCKPFVIDSSNHHERFIGAPRRCHPRREKCLASHLS